MAARSAGVLLYRRGESGVLVLLAHPGGPFWRSRDAGAWMIPKGEMTADESALDAARRELEEELGRLPSGTLEALGSIRQSGGKIVEAFALEGDFDPAALSSNTFEVEWPPHSGRIARFPEIDKVEWMTLARAREMILPSQRPLLDRLEERLAK